MNIEYPLRFVCLLRQVFRVCFTKCCVSVPPSLGLNFQVLYFCSTNCCGYLLTSVGLIYQVLCFCSTNCCWSVPDYYQELTEGWKGWRTDRFDKFRFQNKISIQQDIQLCFWLCFYQLICFLFGYYWKGYFVESFVKDIKTSTRKKKVSVEEFSLRSYENKK